MQKIPPGYKMLRLRGRDIYAFKRDDCKIVNQEMFLSKQDTVNAMWADFRQQATVRAAEQALWLKHTMITNINADSFQAA